MAKTSSASLEDLLKQAKTTNRLLAAQLKANMAQQDLVRLLSSTDLTAREIADVLDTTAATVQVTLGRLKKKAEKSATKAKVEIPPETGSEDVNV